MSSKNKSFYVKLQAINHKKNVNRTYEIILDKGLFNTFIVLVGWGRCNTTGKQVAHSFDTQEDAQDFIRKKINKRQNAIARIGCNYEIVYQRGELG